MLLKRARAVFLPSPGEVSPVRNHVARQVSVSVSIGLRRGEGFAEHELQVIGVVGSHPVVVGSARPGQ